MLDTSLAPWPHYDQEEQDAVAAVLRSGRVNYWTGSQTREFERKFAAFADCPHAVAVSNGTVALDLALKGLGIGPGDEVVVTPRTFIASVSSVVNAGATPIFADVDRESGNITASTIAPVLSERTRAIIPVHLGGWPCDMPAILELAETRNLIVIEDCAQAHGAKIEERSVGSFGHAGAWSFCQDKIMTTGGEGGLVTCRDEGLRRAMWSYKDHGKDWDAVYETEHPPGFRWIHESFGTNWRMMEIQAALGLVQLQRMPRWSERRAEIAGRYAGALSELADIVRVPELPEGVTHAWYRFYAYLELDGLRPGWSRERILEETAREGVPIFQGSCSEVYREGAFDGTPWRPAQRLPAAAELGETSLMFLTHPTLTDADVDRVIDVTCKVLRQASR